MVFICKYCEESPNLHSFRVFSDDENNTVYYSSIAQAKDKKNEQIVYHIEGYLKSHHDESLKTWSWIIDSHNFKFEWHLFKLFKELIKIYEFHKNSLLEIRIINLNKFMKFFLKLCLPFVSKELKSKLIIL